MHETRGRELFFFLNQHKSGPKYIFQSRELKMHRNLRIVFGIQRG